jgi:hypothetical protein
MKDCHQEIRSLRLSTSFRAGMNGITDTESHFAGCDEPRVASIRYRAYMARPAPEEARDVAGVMLPGSHVFFRYEECGCDGADGRGDHEVSIVTMCWIERHNCSGPRLQIDLGR